MNWRWYWHVKLQHKRRKQCSGFMALDSFEMFKHQEQASSCRDQIIYEIPKYALKIVSLHDRYLVKYCSGSYSIPIDKQSCHYGGFRYYFRCPGCAKRVRLLYCNEGKFLCRKCLNLCYFTQLLKPSDRCLEIADKVEQRLKNKAGSLNRKPPWMKHKTFEALRRKQFEYAEVKFPRALKQELMLYYPQYANKLVESF